MNSFSNKVLNLSTRVVARLSGSIAYCAARSTPVLAGTAAVLIATVAPAVWAESLDCARHLQDAQAAIDKVSEDLTGMEMMPKDQLANVHALVNDAKKYLESGHRACDQAPADLDRARGVAEADAAKGYATAADILHWHYMKPPSGSTAMQGMHMHSGASSDSPAMAEMQHGATSGGSAMPGMHAHGAMSMGK